MEAQKRELTLSVVGAGRVGTTLAVLLHRRRFKVVSVISRRKSSAKQCASLVGCHHYSNDLSDLSPESRFLLIATPDEVIPRVAKEVAVNKDMQFTRLYAAHTAGAITSDALAPLDRRGAKTFSLHPIQTFPKSLSLETQLLRMKGITYGVEGAKESLRFAQQVVRYLGGRFLSVPKEEKILYHLACVFASNYMVSLVGAIDEVARSFVESDRLQEFVPLMESSLRNAIELSPLQALTGPISRGSVETIKEHLHALRRRNKRDLRMLYKALGLFTLSMSEQQGRLSPNQLAIFKKLLRIQ